MPSRSGPSDAALRTAHPHDIGVQEFASYALILDVRSRAAYGEDHIPGAISVPLETAGGRTRRGKRSVDSAKSKPARSGADAPPPLHDSVKDLRSEDAVLLYGTHVNAPLADTASSLRARGLVVDVLAGGWPNYRRWVEAGLEALPRRFALRHLVTPPSSDVMQIVDALCELGEQVIDIGACVHTNRGSGPTPGCGQALSQPALETWLLNTLRHRETDRVVWVIGAFELPAALHLPPALREALARSPGLRLENFQPEATISSQIERLLLQLRRNEGHTSP